MISISGVMGHCMPHKPMSYINKNSKSHIAEEI